MPIDRSCKPSSSARRRTVANAPASSRLARRSHCHQATDIEPDALQPRHQGLDGIAGAASVSTLASGRVDLDEDRRTGGEPRDAHPFGLSCDALPQSDHWRQLRHLVALHGAEEMPHDARRSGVRGTRGPGSPGRRRLVLRDVGRLCEELGCVVLAQVAEPGLGVRRATASAPKPLVTATTRTAAGSPPASSMRSLTARSTPGDSVAVVAEDG